MRGLAGAGIESDHSLILAKLRLRLRTQEHQANKSQKMQDEDTRN